MKTYKVIIRGREQGTIKTEDIKKFVEENYTGARYEVDEENATLHLSVSLLDAMRIGSGGAITTKTQAAIDVLNSLEVIDQEGGDHAYILVADNEENRQKLRAVGVTDEQITGAGDDGESFCLLALAFSHKLADTYENGKFVIWGPIDDELRYRVLEGNGTADDAYRLLKTLEPDSDHKKLNA